MRHSPLTEFALLASRPDDALDLESLCLSIGRMRDPDLDEQAARRGLDQIASSLADEALPSLPPDRLAAALQAGIGRRLGFPGAPSDYALPESSMLDQVTDRRRGLPILLSVVWVLVGQRLRLPIRGVAYPGHFLVCLDTPGARIFLDPFAGGERREGRLLLEEAGGRREALAPVQTRAILLRILTNLKHLALSQERWQLGVDVMDRLLLLAQDAPLELRDRGLFLLGHGRIREAAEDLRRYLRRDPDAPDRAEMEALIQRLRAGDEGDEGDADQELPS